MQLQNAIQHVVAQLSASLEQLTDSQYTHASVTLSNATIGQHVRHIIEMYTCLEEGYECGIVNYEHRKRDANIEKEKSLALALLTKIVEGLHKENKTLVLKAAYNISSDEVIDFDTNYYREIAYNLEHTIHHMALIKVGIREISDISIPEGFGVASSTIKFREACAQ
jgi:hypothetical protein